MKFQIVIIQPESYLHSRCFEEVAALLVLSLRDLGYEVELTYNRLHPQRMNIILGYHLLPGAEPLSGAAFAVYQLEHLSALPDWLQERALGILQKADFIWEYSEVNRQWLQERGLKSTPLIPGYHPQMEKIQRVENPDCDLLFYGVISPRRRALLSRIQHLIPGLKILEGIYGAERDQWIGRSKAVINLHAYDRPLAEAVRLSYLLNNRCVVVSEDSEAPAYISIPSTRIDFGELDRLVDLLGDPKVLRGIAERDALAFKEGYAMRALLERALKEVI